MTDTPPACSLIQPVCLEALRELTAQVAENTVIIDKVDKKMDGLTERVGALEKLGQERLAFWRAVKIIGAIVVGIITLKMGDVSKLWTSLFGGG